MRASGKIISGILVLPVLLAVGYLHRQREPDKLHFYFEDDLEHDVWRIPVVEPYQLITADISSQERVGDSRWSFQDLAFTVSFNPDSINYQRGFITFHDASQRKYGICDVTYKSVTFCRDYEQFKAFANKQQLSKYLYNTDLVYEGWSQTRLLPWAKEILEQRWNLTSKK